MPGVTGMSCPCVSLWVPRQRAASRRLARLARGLVPSLRRSDVIIRLVTDRLAVVLPRADARVADAIIARALAGVETAVFVGIATFPQDGLTWAALRRSRESESDHGPRRVEGIPALAPCRAPRR